ncbi:hypothetical protein AB0H76_19490 [Nocardia sp. NPDC050712]|uniref:hypothetical protein n=1 Tax=Nocardia sp. NPDC050712 TaxID=3155518 RepID=UPI0033DCD2A0
MGTGAPDDPVELVLRELQVLRRQGGATVGTMLATETFPVLNYLLNRPSAARRLERLVEVVGRVGTDNDVRRYARRGLHLPDDDADPDWAPFASRATITRRTAEAMTRVARCLVEEAGLEGVEFFDNFAVGVPTRAVPDAGTVAGPEQAELIRELVVHHRCALIILKSIRDNGGLDDHASDIDLLLEFSAVLLARISENLLSEQPPGG